MLDLDVAPSSPDTEEPDLPVFLAQGASVVVQATLVELRADGCLLASIGERLCICDVLLPGGSGVPVLAPGDRVLVVHLARSERPVVLGRIGRYTDQSVNAQVTIEATECLTLRCGEASVDLRADGKVMIRGEDVLVRAKGTKRIRAGTVSIN